MAILHHYDKHFFLDGDFQCPCSPERRHLQEGGEDDAGSVWQIVYTCIVLALMFTFLVTDRLGADSIMLTALTALMVANIISVSEGLSGFANSGLLTVLVLFVVADGISKTGALDWYMQGLLGRPQSVASAQVRLMLPIAIVSAFLNNTPVVAVLIPIVLRWAKNIRLPAQQLLVPLSFASILGGTCTLIGTSTNLVVVGLLEERYAGEIQIGLFDLGKFGVPVALAGMAYILLVSPYLLPSDTGLYNDDTSDLLLGARLTPWSPAAGRTIRRSGLRDTGGIFLVSVHRAATGNVHRAVSADFVLQPGDILYFTGLVESFGEFCLEHALQVMTSEEQDTKKNIEMATAADDEAETEMPKLLDPSQQLLHTVGEEDNVFLEEGIPVEVGVTKESLLQADDVERLRNIVRMTDIIRGSTTVQHTAPEAAPKVVVTIEKDLVVVGVDARDRTGLLLDISKSLLRFHVQLRHTEAAVVGDRSISIWRCEVRGTEIPDIEAIWSVLNDLLSDERGTQKERGLRVIRARVAKGSRLVGRTTSEVNFRRDYGVALIAPSLNDKVQFKVGDQLVLQAADDSPLLERPATDAELDEGNVSRSSSVGSFVKKLAFRKSLDESSQTSQDDIHRKSSHDRHQLQTQLSNDDDFGFFADEDDTKGDDKPSVVVDRISNVTLIDIEERKHAAWRDLNVIFREGDTNEGTREFLTAMAVSHQSQLEGKSVKQVGLNKLPDLYLVTIDRPAAHKPNTSARHINVLITLQDQASDDEGSVMESVKTEHKSFEAIDQDEALQEGDILWFSGPAHAVGDLRKIPGLVSYENEEVEKIHGKVLDRRLVQAVIARKGPLVGKTIKSVHFRTRFGAAVIAVHRGGSRVHEHPGNVKLHGGDVLLLEAGPSFVAKNAENDRSFALLAEVADSAPPRLKLLVPSLIITALMLAVFMANLTSLLVSGLVASVCMVAYGILSEQEARDAVNWEVYITIASAFGIGRALENSGIADAMANFLVNIGTSIPLGDAGLLGAVYFATFLVSNVVTNNAAAALLFPIALNAAEQTGTDRLLMSFSLMLGASASFMTPFGYTTNLLIYGPGGYKYNDFLKFGTPMQLVLLVLSTVFLVIADLWWISWLATTLVLILVVLLRVGLSTTSSRKTPIESVSNGASSVQPESRAS